MSEIALARINSFAHMAQQADVLPSEESVFVLTSSQLDEKMAVLESTQDTQADNELNMLRLINDLRKDREPEPLQKDRGEILRALIAANNGKMLAKEARQKMHLSESRFSELLTKMKDKIGKRPYHLDRTQNIIILK